MPVDQSLVGREFPPTQPYRVSAEKVRELAASECVRFARETGCRWRELAVAARGFDDYAAPLSEAFRLYGRAFRPT